MSGRLKEVLDTYLMLKGNAGKAELAVALKKSYGTIERWLRDGVPTAHDAYQLALACGCTDEEARKIGKERTSREAKRAG